MSINDRIQELVDCFERGEKKAFADKVGIPQTTLGGILGHRKSDVKSATLEKIVQAYRNINPIWLLTGEGDMQMEESGNLNTQMRNATALTKKENEKKEGNAAALTKKETVFSNEGKTKSTEKDNLIDNLISNPKDNLIDNPTSEIMVAALEQVKNLRGKIRNLNQEKERLLTALQLSNVEQGKALARLEDSLKTAEDLRLQLEQSLKQIEKLKLEIEQKTIEETVVQEMRDEYEKIISNLRNNVVEYMVKDLQFGSAAKKRRGETVDWEEDEEEEKEDTDFPKSDSKSA